MKARELKPCEVELGHCCLIERWAGCWENGHEPQDRDERKCPKSAAEVDALYEQSVDEIIARGRRNARRATKSGTQTDAKPSR